MHIINSLYLSPSYLKIIVILFLGILKVTSVYIPLNLTNMNFIVAYFLVCDVFPLEYIPAVLLSERKCGAEGTTWMKSSSFSK